MKNIINLLKTKIIRFLLESKNDKIIISVLLVLGFILRLYKIDNPIADWHSFRQADTASVAYNYVINGIDLLMPKYHDISRVQSGIFNPGGLRFVEFPIYNALHALLYSFIPKLTFDASGRLLSVFLSLISAVFVYLIGKNINRLVGLFAAFLFIFLPYSIFYSRVILPEPLAIALSIISFWFFIKYTKSFKSSELYFSAVFVSIGILVKPYVAFYAIPVWLYLIKKYSIRKFWQKKDTLIYLFIVVTPFIFWRMWISRYPEGIPFWKWTLNGDGIRFHPAYFYWIFGERIGKLILGVWGVTPFVLGVFSLIKNKAREYIWLGMGSLIYLLIFATANVRHDYYQTLILPVICLYTAVGFIYIFNNFKETGKYFVGIILLLTFLISAFQVKEYYKVNHPEIILAGQALQRLTPDNALIIASYNGDTAFLYQSKRKGWPVVELPIEELIAEGAGYYASVNLNDTQTIEFEKRFITLEKTDSYIILKLTVE